MQGSRGTQVELEDEQQDQDAGAGPSRRAGPSPRRRWWAVAVVGAVVVAAGAYAVVDDRRQQADLERHVGLPGVVDSLAEPPQEAWRGQLDGSATQLADLVVTGSPVVTDLTTPAVVTGRDLETGAERWRIEGPGGAPGSCVAELEGAGGPVLLCALPVAEDEDAVGMPSLAWRLVDPTSGEVTLLPETVGKALPVSVFGEIDGDLLVAASRDDGSAALVRYDIGAGEVAWESPLPQPPDAFVDGNFREVSARGELAVVRQADLTLLFDADGQQLHRLDREQTTGPAPERLPLLLRTEHGAGVWTGRETGTWFAPDGTRTADLVGRPLDVDVVGDTERVAVLRRDGGVVGVDVTTGDELWERPLEGRARAQLDGRLVLSDRDRLLAVDVRTGEDVWQTDLGPTIDAAAWTLTDGVRIALPGLRDGRVTLTAFDLASGREVWDTRLPEGTSAVQRYGRAVVAVTPVAGSEQFVVLR
jgi:outer membrane protein assembly factor BamB